MDDKSIVELYWQRDELAIKETSKKYGKYCFSIAYGILDNREDAEESVNDTYNQAWNSIPPHRPSPLASFLGKITRRISIDKFRYRTSQKRGGGQMPLVLDELDGMVPDGDSIEDEYEKLRLSKTVNEFITGLPDTEQRVFMCRYWYMESIGTIAERFGFSETKVRSMLMRTRDKLRKLLVKEGFYE